MNLLARQAKPFIDHNLQIQIPEQNRESDSEHHSLSPIYTHYMGASHPSYVSEVNENELYKAMEDAELAYQSWQRMKEQICTILKSNK